MLVSVHTIATLVNTGLQIRTDLYFIVLCVYFNLVLMVLMVCFRLVLIAFKKCFYYAFLKNLLAAMVALLMAERQGIIFEN